MFNSDEEYVEAQSEYDNYKEAKSEYYKVNSEYENYLHSFSSIFASVGEESIVRDSHWKFMDDKDDKRERERKSFEIDPDFGRKIVNSEEIDDWV